MDLSTLLEQALADRGNAVMLIARPRDGEDAVIRAGNAPFARIMGWPADGVAGLRIARLQPLIERQEDWSTFIAALRALAALTLDLRLRVNGREVWLGFNLTFRTDAEDGAGYGILIGRDITEARERNLRETESQRLLASVFLRIAAAVAIIDGDNAILMANPACQQLLGYGPAELTGIHVEDVIAPESAEAVRAARARQLSGAGDYVLRMALLAKGGAQVAVTLHSTLLRDARDRRLRVATLIPDPAPPEPPPDPMPKHDGDVRSISLAALGAAYGTEWPRMAERAMQLAEQVLRRHLDTGDVVRRRDDRSLWIWFDAADGARNDAVLAAATREIRQRLLAADGAPHHRDGVSIGAEALPAGPGALPAITSARPPANPPDADDPRDGDDSRDADDPPLERDPRALLRHLRAVAVADVASVTGRDGVERPFVLVDFEPAVRGCLYDLQPSLRGEPDRGTGFDLLRLDLAARVLADRPDTGKVLLPISWPVLADPDFRLTLERRLTGFGPLAGARLIFAVSGVPPLLSAQRWSEAVAKSRRQRVEVGLLLTHRDVNLSAMRDAITSEWPLSLLVVDRTEGPPVIIDEYRGLFAAARRRELPVLVRTTARTDLRDWRELGATMFVIAA